MAKQTVEIKVLDIPEVQEIIKKAEERIKTLESALQEFVDFPSHKDALEHENFIFELKGKFKQLLEENEQI